MSKYTVTHACGHQITHQLLGDRKIASLEKCKCRECERIDRRDRTLQQIASEISAETDSAGRLLWRASVRGQRAGISSARCDR